MNFSAKITNAIRNYHSRKGLGRLLFGDQPAIKALLKLPITDRNDPRKLYQCFLKHPPKPQQASYKVCNAIFDELMDQTEISDVLNLFYNHFYDKKLLTQDHRDAMQAHADPKNLATALHYLHYAKFLTAKNVDAVIQSANPENLVNGLYILHHAKLLTKNYRDVIIKSNDPQNCASALRTLYENKLLTRNNYNAVITYADPAALAMALNKLANSGFLTQNNINHVLKSKGTHAKDLAEAFKILYSSFISTQENIAAVMAHAKPLSLAKAFEIFANDTRLNADNRRTAITHANPEGFAKALHILRNIHLLTQDNLDQLSNQDNDFLLSNWAQNNIWRNFRLLQILHQNTFDEFIQLAQQENPQQAIERYMNCLLGRNARDINDAQSIHNIAVEKSTSECVIRLKKHYGTKIEGDRLHQTLHKVKTYISNLSDENICNRAAKRCIDRLFSEENSYFHGILKITTLELLALVFIAIHDDALRTSTLEDALAQLVSILYRIQRGDNFSKKGIDHDTTSTDRPICTSGTFGMLAHSLDGFHNLFKHLFMNTRTASLKLLALVREKAQEHLLSLADNIQTTQDVISLSDLIDRIQKEGIEIIFDAIKESVANCMFDEFCMLYDGNRNSQKFNDDVNAGKDAELTHRDLSALKAKIYRKLESKQPFQDSNLMSSYLGTFFSSYKNHLIQNRHQSSKAQQEYDKRFALVVAKNPI